MTEHIANLGASFKEFLLTKYISILGASVTVGAANLPATGQYIDFTTTGLGPFTIAGWISLTGLFWLFTQIIDKWGFFRLIKWLWERYKNRGGDQ